MSAVEPKNQMLHRSRLTHTKESVSTIPAEAPRTAITGSCRRTSSTHAVPASPAADHPDAERPQNQRHTADHPFPKHESTRDDDQPDPPILPAHPRVVHMFDDAADEPRKRERRRVEEPDRKRHPGRYPLRVRPAGTDCIRLRRRHEPEENREKNHEDAALLRKLSVAYPRHDISHERGGGRGRSKHIRTKQPRETEPHERGRGGERWAGDLVGALVQRVRSSRDYNGQTRPDELSVELRARRGADEMSRLQVLHEVSGPAPPWTKGAPRKH